MTGNDIFVKALDLCGLRAFGGAIPADCEDLMQRSVELINLLLAENAYLDSLIKKTPEQASEISNLSDTLEISPAICSTVLPYGLASLFMRGEDDAAASFFTGKYESERRLIASRLGGEIKKITEVY